MSFEPIEPIEYAVENTGKISPGRKGRNEGRKEILRLN
jgi:hypothetical protein